VYLAGAADIQSNSRFALREHRELISKEDLHEFHQRYPQLQDTLFVFSSINSHYFRVQRISSGKPPLPPTLIKIFQLHSNNLQGLNKLINFQNLYQGCSIISNKRDLNK
jgi:hypothetical protein